MMTLAKSEILNELARRDFRYFIKATFPNFHFSAFSNQVADALNQFIIDVSESRRPILIVEAPAQHGKTTLVSRLFPAFALGRNPDYRIAACSYSSDLATMINRDVQRIMLSPEYQAIFPESALYAKKYAFQDSQATRNSEMFEIVGHKGRYFATGVGGALTGKSVDIGIIDDPVKNMQEARSPTTRAFIESWYNTVFSTRLSAKSGQLIMMTRWHINDLVGYLKAKNKDNERLKVLTFKAIDDDGRALVPSLHPIDQLLEMKATMSAAEWSALYQQNPIVDGGNLIHTNKFNRVTSFPSSFAYSFITADTAFSEKKKADGSAFLHFGVSGEKVYVLNGYWKQVTFPNLRRDLKSFYLQAKERTPNLSCVYIENKASGISLIQQLKEDGLPIQELYPTVKNAQLKKDVVSDKFTRWLEVESDVENGLVHIPESAPWVNDFLRQCEAFTGGNQDEKDDYVDAFIYGLKTARKASIVDWEKVLYENF